MIGLKWWSFASILGLTGCASGTMPPWQDPQLRQFVSPSLQRFENRASFDQYLARLHGVAERRGAWWAAVRQPASAVLLASTEPVLPCDPSVDECTALQEVIVTARRRESTSPSITNNQEIAVDEGDIVKSFGRFLIALQDGRLFSVDTGSSASELALVDRIDIYPDADQDTWYDEQ